jgi:SnoaL-like domain
VNAEERLRAERAIKRLKTSYVRHVDAKKWKELEALFTPDFEFDGIWSIRGAPPFLERLRKRLRYAVTEHRLRDPDLQLTSADSAAAVWPFTDDIDQRRAGIGLLRRGEGLYHETYVKAGGRWRIASMRITRVEVDCEVHRADGEVRRVTLHSQQELVDWLRDWEGGSNVVF